MITIKSPELTVLLRDPHEDLEQLGSRYCHGGYIWQAYDKAGRPLLSGPRYPDPAPPPFDGQGMPEAFKIPELVQPCRWDIDRGEDYAAMTATQESMTLRREVRVRGSRVESTTTVRNIGGDDMPIRWFAHPFFPINSGLACGKIAPKIISLPENAGYYLDEDGTLRMKPDYPWQKGLFQPIETEKQKLTFAIPHPVAGSVILSTDYDVAYCPIWANANTFSFEPFTERAVKPRESAVWGVSLSL